MLPDDAFVTRMALSRAYTVPSPHPIPYMIQMYNSLLMSHSGEVLTCLRFLSRKFPVLF